MKTTLTLFLLCFTFSLSPLRAQDINQQAARETRQMAAAVKMSKNDFRKINMVNADRLKKIAALTTIREQDRRYLDMRLDQIDEEYNATMYKLLSTNQYRSFVKYRQEQPFTYASLVMKYNMVAQAKE